MPRNYRTERDAVIKRWYGGNPQPKNPRPHRTWEEGPISPADCLGVPTQVNAPFHAFGHCMVWKYSLNKDGYGTVTIDGKRVLAHRATFTQTRGPIPARRQINHLCNRPYCVQPSHLYAGTGQDNKDDSQIFAKEELLHAPWILHWPEVPNVENPLLQRLLESNRYDGAEPWEPVEQPAQKPLEEFACPEHDFAIPMFGGMCRICRICEASEVDERFDELGTPSLIKELCPASQTVTSIFEKITASEFFGESHRETRRKAYLRNRQGLAMGSHDLRSCGCDYCTQDRRAFRAAIQPALTGQESEILDICDRLEPHITATLEEASAVMAEAWGKAVGLNDEQAQVLREHLKDCTNTQAELTRTSRTLEGELAFVLYALAKFSTREEMLEDHMFRQIMYRCALARMRKGDREHLEQTVLPSAEKATNGIVLAWDKESDALARPYIETKPDFYNDIRSLAKALVVKQVLEFLRYELLGRNSFSEQKPYPHHGCAVSIVETGRVEPFPIDFQEGMGYSPREP